MILFQTSRMQAIEQKPEELVARHLDSVGAAATRAANKTCVVQGTPGSDPVGGRQPGGIMDIHLYFDPETYGHVMTTYSITAATGFGTSVPSTSDQAGVTTPSNLPGGDPTQSSKQQEIRYTLEERGR